VLSASGHGATDLERDGAPRRQRQLPSRDENRRHGRNAIECAFGGCKPALLIAKRKRKVTAGQENISASALSMGRARGLKALNARHATHRHRNGWESRGGECQSRVVSILLQQIGPTSGSYLGLVTGLGCSLSLDHIILVFFSPASCNSQARFKRCTRTSLVQV